MSELARRVTSQGRIYFTGGASAVLYGWRDATLDLDIKAAPEPGGLYKAVGQLKEDLDISLEFASPDDFVPALPGWEDRSVFIEQHGKVTFLHYDFYGQALAKAERFHVRDKLDIKSMLKDGLVKPERLMELYLRVVDNLGRYAAVEEKVLRDRLELIARGEL